MQGQASRIGDEVMLLLLFPCIPLCFIEECILQIHLLIRIGIGLKLGICTKTHFILP